MAELIRSFRDLRVYQEMFALQQEVFVLSKRWPSEEKYSLTDQVRRSARAMGANVSESWGKRRYPAHFVSKLTDADGEVQETSHWLATALACDYLLLAEQQALQQRLDSIGAKLGKMISKPESFMPKM
jgi:four helix bundle protein